MLLDIYKVIGPDSARFKVYIIIISDEAGCIQPGRQYSKSRGESGTDPPPSTTVLIVYIYTFIHLQTRDKHLSVEEISS